MAEAEVLMEHAPSKVFSMQQGEISWLFYNHDYEAAFSRLKEAISHPEGLSEWELRYLQYMQRKWQRAVDLNYLPPERDIEDAQPLLERYRYYFDCEPHIAEQTLWQYIQHCPFGTSAFQDAVEMLVEHALWRENFALARHAAQLLLNHYAILNIARQNHLTPVTFSTIAAAPSASEDVFPVSLPYWEAIDALEHDDAPCWAEILEITLQDATLEKRKEYYYPRVLAALKEHYRNTNNFSRMEWIKVYGTE